MTPELAAGTAPARVASRRKRSPAVFWLQVLLIAAVVAAVGAGLYQLTIEQTQGGGALPVPATIGGYQLQDVVRGDEAVAELTKLHGKDIGMTTGWIGYYQSRAVAWVAIVPDEERAFQLLDAMNKRIAASNGPFTNLQTQETDGQTVFTVVGQGQRHYYYQKEKLVVWLAAPKGGEERFLQGALEAIRAPSVLRRRAPGTSG